MRYAVIDGSGAVRNFIEWDGEKELAFLQGWSVREAAPGDVIAVDLGATVEDARAQLTASVEERARALRIEVAGTDDATKLSVYREKYATALRALDGDQNALAALEPEATARGETPAELAALVKSLGDAWIAAGLAIDAAYQTHKAAIVALASLQAAKAYDLGAGWPF